MALHIRENKKTLTTLVQSIHCFHPHDKRQGSMNKIDIKQNLAGLHDLYDSYHVSRLGLFGSYVRGDQDDKSDIDLLVEFGRPIDLFAYVNLRDRIARSIDRDVDLVTVGGI